MYWKWHGCSAQQCNGANDDVYFIDWRERAGIDQSQCSIGHPCPIACRSSGEALRLGNVEEHLHRIGTSRGDLDQTVAQARCSDEDPIGDRDGASLSKRDERDHCPGGNSGEERARRSREAHAEEFGRGLVKIEDQPDAVPTAEWECRKDEPVRDAVGVDDVDRMIAVNAEQLACGQHSEATVLNHVGADPSPLVALNGLAVELGTVEFTSCGIAVTLKGDDADLPAGGDGGAGGAANAWIFIYVRVHHECQVWHGLPRLL